MNNETKEKFRSLCESASVEQDPERLMQLVREIDRLLEGEKTAREQRGSAHRSKLIGSAFLPSILFARARAPSPAVPMPRPGVT